MNKHKASRSCTPSRPASPARSDAPGGGRKATVVTGADELRRKRKAERESSKLARKRGAILARSRADEGFVLTSGRQESCLPDAVDNAMKLDGATATSLARLRSLSIPKLGNVLQASWQTCRDALLQLHLPYELVEATARFQGGPPMLNLLRASSGVFVVALLVEVDGKKNDHCIAFSATRGVMVDNGATTKPVYIEEADRRGKKAARDAFRQLVAQRVPANATFSVDVTDIFELRRV